MKAKSQQAVPSDIVIDGVEYDANGDIKMPRDRFFDPWRIACTENLKAIVIEAQGLIANYEAYYGLRQRARKPVDQKVFEAIIEAVLCDMMFAYLTKDERGSAVSLSNTVLGIKSRYRSPVYSKTLPAILKAMASPEMGYIRMEKGWEKAFGNRGQRSLIWPAERTIDRIQHHGIVLRDIGRQPFSELITLKAPKQGFWDEAQYQDYDDNDQTCRMRSEMVEINAWLDQADIEIADPALDAVIQTSNRALRRVFTRGSFESGGRLFGGFWQLMKKQDRFYALVIDDDGVVGLDFEQMAPRIAYGLMGAEPPEGDLYKIGDYHDIYRHGIKMLFNSLLSSEKPLERKPRGSKNRLPPVSIEKLVEDISKAHPAIAPLFGTAACHRIQFIESNIMVEVLLELKREGMVGLPIHDGVIVRHDGEQRAREIMEEVSLKQAGLRIPVSTEICST